MGHECKDCTLVASTEAIYVNPKVVRNATVKPVFIGFFTLPEWTGHISFYIFKCPKCEMVSLDYPHGYTDFGLLYLECNVCEKVLPLGLPQNEEIYRREKMPLPPLTLREREREIKKIIPKNRLVVIVGGKEISWLEKMRSFIGL